MQSMIRTFGPELAQSYLVCAITPGEKRPMGRNWINRPLRADECRNFPTESAGVGIICGRGENPVYGIDIDVLEEAAVKDIMQVIEAVVGPDVSYRVGRYPKALVPVRCTQAGITKATTSWFEKDGIRSRVEILGDGQQFVAAAIHPDTQAPYEWHGVPLAGTLVDPADMLPEVTHEQLLEILKRCEDVLRSHGWKEADASAKTIAGASEITAAELCPQYPLGATIDEAREWLFGNGKLDGNDNRDIWLRVGMALHHEFNNRNFDEQTKAVQLWDEWSQGAPNYRGFDDIMHNWESFHSQAGRRCVTIRWLRSEWKKRSPYDKTKELSEVGRAARFAEYFCGTIRHTMDTNEWYRWSGITWKKVFQDEVVGVVAYTLDDLLRHDIKELGLDEDKSANAFYRQMQNSKKAKAILEESCHFDNVMCLSTDFNADPRYVGAQNTIIDLETMTEVEARPEMYVSLQLGTVYDKEARCPLWEETILDIFEGDAEMVDYVQRYFGYSLLGEPNEEVMAVFYGNGSNGKSTIVNVMRDLFGEYGHTADGSMLTTTARQASQNSGGARADIVALVGKRFVVVSEIDQAAHMQEAQLKKLVSTDEISARGLYEGRIRTFRPTWSVTMLTNYLPTVRGSDNGIWRRLATVPFNRNFEADKTRKKDPERAKKLRKELPGILNWVLDGVRKYRERGLTQPAAVKAESNEYRQAQDFLAEWLNDECTLRPNYQTPTSQAWASWTTWLKLNSSGYTPINDKTKLTRELKKRGVLTKACYHEGTTTRCYIGLKIGKE